MHYVNAWALLTKLLTLPESGLGFTPPHLLHVVKIRLWFGLYVIMFIKKCFTSPQTTQFLLHSDFHDPAFWNSVYACLCVKEQFLCFAETCSRNTVSIFRWYWKWGKKVFRNFFGCKQSDHFNILCLAHCLPCMVLCRKLTEDFIFSKVCFPT